MNISFQNNIASRYNYAQGADAQTDAAGGTLHDAAEEAIDEVRGGLEKLGSELGGLSNGGPGDWMRNSKHDSFGSFELGAGHGLDGIDMTGRSVLEDLAQGLGSDVLGQAEGMANGKHGAGSLTPNAQDMFDNSMGQLGSSSKGGGWLQGAPGQSALEHGFGIAGGIVGCVVGGMFAGPAGCGAGAEVGHVVGSALGMTVDSGVAGCGRDGAQGSDGSGQTSSSYDGTGGTSGAGASEDSKGQSSENASSSETKACDEKSQSCSGTTQAPPSSDGMGDDQEDSGMGDPVFATLTLQRRAKTGDGAAASVLEAGKGNAEGVAPGWDVQPSSEDSSKADGRVLGRVARHGDNFEGPSYYQHAGALPPKEFVDGVVSRAADPVVQPLPA